MCCFFVPGAEAIALSAVSLILKRGHHDEHDRHDEKRSFSQKLAHHLTRLSHLLYGGSLLLALEHIWHGEIMFAPPFITAMQSPEDTAVMLEEMSTAGVSMALLVTLSYAAYELIKAAGSRFAAGRGLEFSR
ncbi:MAG: hypothetical protein VZR11_01645 [Succinimonas sp.]|jgi:hypothetical protein|nr:hypothetical protein [Succinimonas sp.]